MEKRYNFKVYMSDGNCHVFNAMFEGNLQDIIDKITNKGIAESFSICDDNHVAHIFYYKHVVNIDIHEAKVKE